MKKSYLLNLLSIVFLLLLSDMVMAQTTVTIGTNSSSSSTRGPLQRSDTASTTVYSRFIQVYTAAELATAGLTNGVEISQLNWELASSNTIIGTGNATLKVYIKNSTATEATSDTWANHIDGSTLAYDGTYNSTNNFPGANGWMPFEFSSGFAYTGGALEIAVDWDCSAVSTPAFSGNGAIKWRWESTGSDNLVVKKTSSSAPSTSITDLKSERANIQIVYDEPSSCETPSGLGASNITSISADLNWAAADGATQYMWKIVAAGAGSDATAVDSGTETMTSASSSMLMELTGYDLYVQTDCGGGETSDYGGPYSFSTPASSAMTMTIGEGTSSSSTRGPFQRSDTNSSTVFSRFVHIYTETELAAGGIATGDMISALHWELASSNTIIGSGDATLKVYIKNSSATEAASDTWDNHIDGSTLAVDNAYNTSNNFPGENGWMAFNFSAPFEYTGGALEIAVDWDCSQVSTPAFSGDGALKWRWESTAPDNLVVKKTSSSSPSSTISDLKNERANIQIVHSTTTNNEPDSVNVTFQLNTSWITTDAAGMYVAGGGNFGNPGDNPMSDDDGDGVWEWTVKVPVGFSSHYTFTNGNCPDWSCKENIAGQSCADPNNFNDRWLPGVYSDTTINTCFAWCSDDGSCPMPPDSFDVTFVVDMSQETVDAAGLFLAGSFEGWQKSIVMTDTDGDMVYEALVTLPEGDIEYKFVNGDWPTAEEFDPTTSDSVCTLTSGGFTNRFYSVMADVNLDTVCYDSCFACPQQVGINNLIEDNNLFSIQPNVTQDNTRITFADNALLEEKTLRLFNAFGQLEHVEVIENNSVYSMNVNHLAAGIYFVNVQSGNRTATKRLIITK